jgi:hypothetical protein
MELPSDVDAPSRRIFAVEEWKRGRGDGTTARSLAVAGTIVALALALMLLGSLPSQPISPVATLYRSLDRFVKRLFGDPPAASGALMKLGRRVAAGLIWIFLVALVLVALAAAVYGFVRLDRWIFDQAPSWTNEHPWIIVATAALVVIGWTVGYWSGWRLRSWNELTSGSGVVYRIRGVPQSSGVAATWSVIYGTCYAVIAAGIIWWWSDDPNWVWRSALATAVVFALLLLYVVPPTVLVGSIRVVRARLVRDKRSAMIAWPAQDASQDDVIKALWKYDVHFRCLLTRSTPQATSLKLTRTGRRLRTALDQIV